MARAKRKQADRQWIIPCRVTVTGAHMLVEAPTRDEAIAKAKRNEWYDVLYAQAEMTDWEPDYAAIEPDE